MPYTCKKCQLGFGREHRQQGKCPNCGSVFDSAELIALCIGLGCMYLIALVLPELAAAAFIHPGVWHGPTDTQVIFRAGIIGGALAGTLIMLFFEYDLWQGEALNAHPWLRLLWLFALPGLVYAGAVLAAGVAYLAVRRRLPVRHALTTFLRAERA